VNQINPIFEVVGNLTAANKQMEELMTQLSDDIATLQTAAQAVETAIVDLQAQITTLQGQVPSGTDLSGLEQVVSDLKAASAADPNATGGTTTP
jgi:chaperonin cofactor prefoldin